MTDKKTLPIRDLAKVRAFEILKNTDLSQAGLRVRAAHFLLERCQLSENETKIVSENVRALVDCPAAGIALDVCFLIHDHGVRDEVDDAREKADIEAING